ncbi:hypothetical protein [Paenibacillus sp. KR2-11]|uniref:hypothetical protein n=1 Tax=Paenibacillus sp. KR2-11 TaxID=3385500 RepID=UPI0038FCFFBF
MTLDDILHKYKSSDKNEVEAYSVILKACLLIYPATKYKREERLSKINSVLQDVSERLDSGIQFSVIISEFLCESINKMDNQAEIASILNEWIHKYKRIALSSCLRT